MPTIKMSKIRNKIEIEIIYYLIEEVFKHKTFKIYYNDYYLQ